MLPIEQFTLLTQSQTKGSDDVSLIISMSTALDKRQYYGLYYSPLALPALKSLRVAGVDWMDKIVVTIVDKQALFRVGVRHALFQQSDLEVFDGAPNENPIALIEANPPDVLLLDIDYPSLRGLELAQEIALHCPTTKVIILTYKPDDK